MINNLLDHSLILYNHYYIVTIALPPHPKPIQATEPRKLLKQSALPLLAAALPPASSSRQRQAWRRGDREVHESSSRKHGK